MDRREVEPGTFSHGDCDGSGVGRGEARIQVRTPVRVAHSVPRDLASCGPPPTTVACLSRWRGSWRWGPRAAHSGITMSQPLRCVSRLLCPAPWRPLAHRCTLGQCSPGSPGGAFPAGRVLLLHPKPTLCPLFQYACGVEAEVVGKPSPDFFKSALQEMGVEAHQVGRPHGVRGEAGDLTRGRLGA